MKKFLLISFILLYSLTTYSEEWVSPIDVKYSAKDLEAFSNFSKAREILNSWRGQGEKLKQADELLKQVLLKDQTFAPAYREYGRLFIMAGVINSRSYDPTRLQLAEETILKSLEIEPDYADSYVLLGHLYTKVNRLKDAESALLKAESIGTKIPWLQLNWASLLKKQRRYDEALARYQNIVETGTSNRKAYTSALSGVTEIYRHKGLYKKANEGFKKEIEYEPENAWKWGNYSEFLLFSYDDVDGAIENGQKAINIMNYEMGRFLLACAFYTKWAQLQQDSNKKVEAEKYFQQAWSLYPHPEKIIKKTSRTRYTKITAIELQKWLLSKNRILRGV